jgi:ion channel
LPEQDSGKTDQTEAGEVSILLRFQDERGEPMKQQKPNFESDEDLAQVVTGHGPCTYLLLSLLGLILFFPYATGGILGRILLAVLYSLVLIGGAYAIGRNRRTLIIGVGLAVLGVALQWTALVTDIAALFRLSGIVYVVFLVLTIGQVGRYILKKGPVTADKLHGALAGYIMIAFVWAFIYALIESFTPGSFSFQNVDPNDPHALYRLLYFSFTTLTTVGYGDITPVTEQARSFVMIEEFAGVFFVGVLIARLAGLYPPQQK